MSVTPDISFSCRYSAAYATGAERMLEPDAGVADGLFPEIRAVEEQNDLSYPLRDAYLR